MKRGRGERAYACNSLPCCNFPGLFFVPPPPFGGGAFFFASAAGLLTTLGIPGFSAPGGSCDFFRPGGANWLPCPYAFGTPRAILWPLGIAALACGNRQCAAHAHVSGGMSRPSTKPLTGRGNDRESKAQRCGKGQSATFCNFDALTLKAPPWWPLSHCGFGGGAGLL
jgi:hypothetical protein